MLLKLFSTILIISFNALPYALAGLESAYRNPNIPYEVYERKAYRYLNRHQGTENKFFIKNTPLNKAKKFTEAVLPDITRWKSTLLQTRFEKLRDTRFISINGEERRPSWIYPDDGCYARAAMVNRNVFRWFYPQTKKVFAFGSLRVKTPNSPRGKVGWWYHVAPIIQVKEKKYVLDPAIEPSRPLELSEWVSRMGNPEKIKVAICASGTYSPGDNCDRKTDGLELSAERAQKAYLIKEETRIRRLGRQVEAELGDSPPWLQEYSL